MSKSKAQARSAIKLDLFADAARKHKIETLGDPPQVIARHIDFDDLTRVIDQLLPTGDAAKGGRPPYPSAVMVRILILKCAGKKTWTLPIPRSTARATTATS